MRCCRRGASWATTDGYAFLYRINVMVTENSVERTAALNERFQRPNPCNRKEDLSLALTNWKMDGIELRNLGAPPDPATALSSLKKLTNKIEDLKNLTDLSLLDRVGGA